MQKLVMLIMVIAVLLNGCVIEFAPTDGSNKDGGSKTELTRIAKYENTQLELLNGISFVSEDGKQMMRVRAVYTNNGEEPMYALSSFSVRAFQDDVELTDCSDINGDQATLIQEVKNGQSVEVEYIFETPGLSEVEVLIGTPTADEETIGRAVYSGVQD